MTKTATPENRDPRPVDCRHRQQDEGRPYPRSSCQACGKTITTGLGRTCTFAASPPTAVEPAAVPDGWKLVPVEPTTEMECAVDHEDCATPDAAKAAYRSMLAAAPPSPLDIITVSVIQPEFCGCMAGPNDPDPDCDQCKGTGETSINSTATPYTDQPTAVEPMAVSAGAEDTFARQIWGYFKGDTTGGTTAMQWFDNNKSLGGPAYVRQIVRSAMLATPSTDQPEDFTADVWQQHKDLIEEAGKLREENARLQASLTDEVTVRLNAEARAATLSAAKAAAQADYETRVRSALATPSTDLREENERQPMKLEISKEWFAKRAAMEGDLEIAKLESLLPRQDEITQLRDRAVTAETEIAALKEKLETVVGAIKALVSLNDEHHPVGGQIYQDRVERIWCRAKAALAREGK